MFYEQRPKDQRKDSQGGPKLWAMKLSKTEEFVHGKKISASQTRSSKGKILPQHHVHKVCCTISEFIFKKHVGESSHRRLVS